VDIFTASPDSRNQIYKGEEILKQATYSMEASMTIALHLLNAADHARQTGEIRGFDLCPLDGIETVDGSMIRLSVLTTRSFMRSPNCEFTEEDK